MDNTYSLPLCILSDYYLKIILSENPVFTCDYLKALVSQWVVLVNWAHQLQRWLVNSILTEDFPYFQCPSTTNKKEFREIRFNYSLVWFLSHYSVRTQPRINCRACRGRIKGSKEVQTTLYEKGWAIWGIAMNKYESTWEKRIKLLITGKHWRRETQD